MRDRLIRTMLVCALPISLAGCAVQPAVLPAMPADLAAECTAPDLSGIRDARVAGRLERAARIDCADLHRDTVAFYRDLRAGRPAR